MPDTIVNFREFRQNLAHYLREASRGAEFTVASRGQVLARLGPPNRPGRRALGLLKGEIHMARDFDETPDDLIDLMEGGAEQP